MNLTWYILKKDFVRLRLPLALWVILMVGRFLVGDRILRVENSDLDALQVTLGTLGAMHNVLFGLQLILCCVLVAALIHEDSVVGENAWWVTRPISGARLLGAKLVGLVLFFWVLPQVVSLPWWLYSGFDRRAIGGAVIQLAYTQAALSLLVLLVAVLTANAARFVAMVLLLVFAWMCGFITFLAHSPDVPLGVTQTRALAGVVLSLAVIALVVGHQFLTRRRGRSWVMFSVGFVLMLLLANFWPWDWSRWALWRGSEPPALARVTVAPTGEVAFTKVGSNLDPSLVRMEMGFRYVNLPGDYSLNFGSVTGTLRWPDGTMQKRTGWIQSYPMAISWHIMGLRAPAGVSPEEWRNSAQRRGDAAIIFIPGSYAAKLRQQAPAWTGELELAAYHGELVAEVPFREGAADGRAGHKVRVMRIEHLESGSLVVNLAESVPIPAGEDLPIPLDIATRRRPPACYVLSSRDRTKFVLLRPYAESGTFVNSVVVLRSTFSVNVGQLENPADPHWLDQAEVLKVAYWSVGSLVRPAHSDGLHETQFRNGHRVEPATAPKPAPGT